MLRLSPDEAAETILGTGWTCRDKSRENRSFGCWLHWGVRYLAYFSVPDSGLAVDALSIFRLFQ